MSWNQLSRDEELRELYAYRDEYHRRHGGAGDVTRSDNTHPSRRNESYNEVPNEEVYGSTRTPEYYDEPQIQGSTYMPEYFDGPQIQSRTHMPEHFETPYEEQGQQANTFTAWSPSRAQDRHNDSQPRREPENYSHLPLQRSGSGAYASTPRRENSTRQIYYAFPPPDPNARCGIRALHRNPPSSLQNRYFRDNAPPRYDNNAEYDAYDRSVRHSPPPPVYRAYSPPRWTGSLSNDVSSRALTPGEGRELLHDLRNGYTWNENGDPLPPYERDGGRSGGEYWRGGGRGFF